MATTKQQLVGLMRSAQAEIEPLLVVVADLEDDRLDWSTFGQCTCGIRGLDFGQKGDCRWRTDGVDGLHAHVFEDRYEFHLDQVDACRNPIRHVAVDTDAPERIVFGALLGATVAGAAAYGVGARGKMTAAWAAVGGAAGGVLGGVTTRPRRTGRKLISFDHLLQVEGSNWIDVEAIETSMKVV